MLVCNCRQMKLDFYGNCARSKGQQDHWVLWRSIVTEYPFLHTCGEQECQESMSTPPIPIWKENSGGPSSGSAGNLFMTTEASENAFLSQVVSSCCPWFLSLVFHATLSRSSFFHATCGPYAGSTERSHGDAAEIVTLPNHGRIMQCYSSVPGPSVYWTIGHAVYARNSKLFVVQKWCEELPKTRRGPVEVIGGESIGQPLYGVQKHEFPNSGIASHCKDWNGWVSQSQCSSKRGTGWRWISTSFWKGWAPSARYVSAS